MEAKSTNVWLLETPKNKNISFPLPMKYIGTSVRSTRELVTSLHGKLVTSLRRKLVTSLHEKLVTSLRGKLVTSLRGKLVTSLRGKLVISLRGKQKGTGVWLRSVLLHEKQTRIQI